MGREGLTLNIFQYLEAFQSDEKKIESSFISSKDTLKFWI